MQKWKKLELPVNKRKHKIESHFFGGWATV